VVGKCRPLRNDIALSKLSAFTNHPNADFEDFARQHNGDGGREKDLYNLFISSSYHVLQ
jgi:hypothetical protein